MAFILSALIRIDIQGISSFDYAQNRGLYFCRSVFEVYLREKSNHHPNSRPSTTHSFNNNSTIKMNGYDVTPTPPVNGHATFIRRNGRQSFNDSSSLMNHSPSTLSMEPFSRTTTYLNSPSTISNRQHDDNDDEKDLNGQRYRPPSSTTNNSLIAPPIKPRKSSTTPNSSLMNSSKPPKNPQHVLTTATFSDDEDDEDDANSLEGHRSGSDIDDDQLLRPERPNSRLSLHNNDDHFQPQSNSRLRRPHYKQAKQSKRNPTYDDFRFLDEQQQQQQQQLSPNKPKQSIRSANNKEFPQPSTNRIGSGSGNQTASHRLKSGSKSSSTESIPALDLTVAGQKVFRTKQQADSYMSHSLPSTNAARPPSGRLKPINSAKSSSSYTEKFSQTSSKTLEDVTNNVKQSPTTSTKTHLYKKKLAPLANGNNDPMSKKYSYRPSIDQPPYLIDDLPSDRSEDTTVSTSNGGGGGGGGNRDMKSSNGGDKRSKYH